MTTVNPYTSISTLSDHAGPCLQELDARNRTFRPADFESFDAADVKTHRLPGNDHSVMFQANDRHGRRKTYRYHNPHANVARQHPDLGNGSTVLSFKIEDGMLCYRKTPQLRDIRFRPGSCSREA